LARTQQSIYPYIQPNSQPAKSASTTSQLIQPVIKSSQRVREPAINQPNSESRASPKSPGAIKTSLPDNQPRKPGASQPTSQQSQQDIQQRSRTIKAARNPDSKRAK
jgi:hypothetical protein